MKNKFDLHELMPKDKFSLKIMQERAAILSREDKNEDDMRSLMVDYVKIRLNQDEFYGIPYRDIQEIKPLVNLTSVPMAPQFISGIIYWHGKLISVIDLANFLGLPQSAATSIRYAAIIIKENQILSFALNDVLGVDTYLPNNLDKSIATHNKMKDQYIHGIHQGRITILNMMAIINDIAESLTLKKGISHELP